MTHKLKDFNQKFHLQENQEPTSRGQEVLPPSQSRLMPYLGKLVPPPGQEK